MKLMLRLIVLLPVLAFAMSISASPARAADPVHITHARKFLQAFDSKDAGTMAIIAAQTSRKVPYALVIFSLLESREFEAARKLANLRAGAPEGKGLVLLCEGYVGGVIQIRAPLCGVLHTQSGRADSGQDGLIKAERRPDQGDINAAVCILLEERNSHATGQEEKDAICTRRANLCNF